MNWNSDISYWIQNPQHKVIFKDIYKRDTSRDKKKSSLFMWGVALIYHIESEIYTWEEDKKVDYAKRYVWGDKAKDYGDDHIGISDRMRRLGGGDTAALRQLREWERIMDDKTAFIRTLDYSKDTYRMIEEMLASNTKLYAEYDRIMDMVRKEAMINENTVGGAGS